MKVISSCTKILGDDKITVGLYENNNTFRRINNEAADEFDKESLNSAIIRMMLADRGLQHEVV